MMVAMLLSGVYNNYRKVMPIKDQEDSYEHG